MVRRPPRTRWNWIVLATVAVALAGAWLSAEAGPGGGTMDAWKTLVSHRP